MALAGVSHGEGGHVWLVLPHHLHVLEYFFLDFIWCNALLRASTLNECINLDTRFFLVLPERGLGWVV